MEKDILALGDVILSDLTRLVQGVAEAVLL